MSRCNVNFDWIIKSGNPHHEIVNTIKETNTDLLIIGHKGESNFFGLGSFARKMIMSSPIPVLIARNDIPISKIGCLLDPSRISLDLILYSKEFSKRLQAKAQCLSFVPEPSSAALAENPLTLPIYKYSEKDKLKIIEKIKF